MIGGLLNFKYESSENLFQKVFLEFDSLVSHLLHFNEFFFFPFLYLINLPLRRARKAILDYQVNRVIVKIRYMSLQFFNENFVLISLLLFFVNFALCSNIRVSRELTET